MSTDPRDTGRPDPPTHENSAAMALIFGGVIALGGIFGTNASVILLGLAVMVVAIVSLAVLAR